MGKYAISKHVFLPERKIPLLHRKSGGEEKCNSQNQQSALSATSEEPSKQHYIEELKRLFVSEERYEDQLARLFKGLMPQISEARDLVWSEEDEFSAFDYCEN